MIVRGIKADAVITPQIISLLAPLRTVWNKIPTHRCARYKKSCWLVGSALWGITSHSCIIGLLLTACQSGETGINDLLNIGSIDGSLGSRVRWMYPSGRAGFTMQKKTPLWKRPNSSYNNRIQENFADQSCKNLKNKNRDHRFRSLLHDRKCWNLLIIINYNLAIVRNWFKFVLLSLRVKL